MALTSAAQKAIWLKRLLIDLNVVHDYPIVIQEDNQGAIATLKNLYFTEEQNILTFGIILFERL